MIKQILEKIKILHTTDNKYTGLNEEQLGLLKWAASRDIEAKDICDMLDISEAVAKYKMNQYRNRNEQKTMGQ